MLRSMKKSTVMVMIALAGMLGLGGIAQAYPPGGKLVVISNAAPSAGSDLDVTAQCTPGEAVTFVLDGSSATVTCSDEGTATGVVTAPATPGPYSVSANGTVSGDLGSAPLAVVAQAGGDVPTGGLPATGSDGVGSISLIAVGLVMAGLVFFALASVRRRQPSAA